MRKYEWECINSFRKLNRRMSQLFKKSKNYFWQVRVCDLCYDARMSQYHEEEPSAANQQSQQSAQMSNDESENGNVRRISEDGGRNTEFWSNESGNLPSSSYSDPNIAPCHHHHRTPNRADNKFPLNHSVQWWKDTVFESIFVRWSISDYGMTGQRMWMTMLGKRIIFLFSKLKLSII